MDSPADSVIIESVADDLVSTAAVFRIQTTQNK
jgi:hypothetical protein